MFFLIKRYLNANPGDIFGVPMIPFQYGRMDCPTSPNTDAHFSFGSGHFDFDQLFHFMHEEFGLNLRETVAIMGAHTVGGASGASGFLGFFKGNEKASFKWDSGYYKILLQKGLKWKQVEVSDQTNDARQRWQWEGKKNGRVKSVLLNTDVCLIQDLELNQNGRSKCNFNTCKDNPSTRR